MSYLTNREFLLQVAKGDVPGHSLIHKFGANDNVDTASVPETVWQVGAEYVWQTSAQTIDVTSGNGNDESGGSGARKIKIQGLDASWNLVEEELSMTGATAATTTGSFFRVFRAFVSEVGTYGGSNLGTVNGLFSTSSNPAFRIQPALGQTEMAIYTVPAGYTAYLLTNTVTVDSSKSGASFRFYQRRDADDTSSPYTGATRVVLTHYSVAGEYQQTHRAAEAYPAKTDLWYDVFDVGANDTRVTAEFELLLVEV